MKQLMHIVIIGTMLFLYGCGHGILVESKVTGLGAVFPIADGQHLGLVLGSMETTTATVRGGTSVETTSVAGGGIFSGEAGVNHVTTMKTNAQLNEGNLRDVFLSDKVPPEAKIILASNLVHAAKAPNSVPVVIQAQTAALHSGTESVVSNNVPIINRISGLDNLINQTTTIVTNLSEQVTSGIVNITNNTVDSVTETSSGFFDSISKWLKDIKWITLLKLLLSIVGGIIVYYFFRGSKDKSSPVIRNTDPNTVDLNPLSTDGGTRNKKENKSTPKDIIGESLSDKNHEDRDESGKKDPWYKRLWGFFVCIFNLILRIPPKQRRAIAKHIQDFIASKKANKK